MRDRVFSVSHVTAVLGRHRMQVATARAATPIVAIFSQFTVFHGSAVTAIVLLILTSTIAWLRRDSLPKAAAVARKGR